MSIRPGTGKLGLLIHHWSIPSGLRSICIGASSVCLALCYAMRHHYCRKNVKEALDKNYKESLRKDFVAVAGGWIRSLFARVVRVHASGEFYSAEYVHKWIEITRRNPNVLFFAYTRSWAVPEVLPALRELSRMPNFILWWSCDSKTGAPPLVKGVRRAYLSVTDQDEPKYRVDLVFRNHPKTVKKWIKDALVCPSENGVTTVTCSVCQLCFRDNPIPIKQPKVVIGIEQLALPGPHC
jgi:hypothetical protein